MGFKKVTSAETFRDVQALRENSIERAVKALLDPHTTLSVKQDLAYAEMQNYFDAFPEAGTFASDFVRRLTAELSKHNETLHGAIEQYLLERDIDPEMGPEIPLNR